MRLGVDLMGSDFSAEELLHVLCQAISRDAKPDDQFLLFAQQGTLPSLSLDPRITLVLTPEAIESTDSPLYAIRKKRESSLIQAMHALHDKKIDALISAGNTAAIVASASLMLTPSFERPALIAIVPTRHHPSCVLDVGAAFDFTPQDFLGLAAMGVDFATTVLKRKEPRIGLLNIGQEPLKGNETLRQAHQKLKEQFGNQFIGNVESFGFFDGVVDILLTSALMGNVFLKTAEATCNFILSELGEKAAHLQLDYLPLGILYGFKEKVFKAHGGSAHQALATAIPATRTLLA